MRPRAFTFEGEPSTCNPLFEGLNPEPQFLPCRIILRVHMCGRRFCWSISVVRPSVLRALLRLIQILHYIANRQLYLASAGLS